MLAAFAVTMLLPGRCAGDVLSPGRCAVSAATFLESFDERVKPKHKHIHDRQSSKFCSEVLMLDQSDVNDRCRIAFEMSHIVD